MNKKIVFGILAVCLLLTGCSTINGKLYKKYEVLAKVKEKITDEKYSFDHVEKNRKIRPKADVYYFKSKERDFTFTALSTLENITIDGPTRFYSKSLEINYVDEVHALYLDEINGIISELLHETSGTFIQYEYKSYDDLAEVAKILLAADDVYKAELAYNTQEWMSEYPVFDDKLYYKGPDENGDPYKNAKFGIKLDGSWDYQSLYDYLTYNHIQKVYNGEIVDPTITEDKLSRAHALYLDPYLNGINVKEDASETDKRNGLYNRLDSNYMCAYYYDWDCYIMRINLGLTDHKYGPQVVEYYTDSLFYSATVGENNGEVSWDNGTDRWSVKAKDKRNTITSCVFTKNGSQVDIPYLTTDDATIIGATYVVGIKLDDFAKMFNLKYTIDEEAAAVIFESE